MFGSAREKVLGVGGGLLLGLFLPMGGASAGTVKFHCDCEPDTSATCKDGTTYKWCNCVDSTGLSAWATNEYERFCDNGVSYRKDLGCNSMPEDLVGSLPKNVTCTDPSGISDYQYNDCTNWNVSTRHFDVYTYCANQFP
jgi:hypothetical protein